MSKSSRTILLLAVCQALLSTNNVINIGMNGLVGYMLATNKAWATLPLTAYILGTACSTVPASLFMRRHGRRAGFVLGCLIGIGGTALSGSSVVFGGFWLLVAGNFLTGGYNAFGQYYRFAASESANAAWKSRAISLVLAGGIGGAFLGPESAKLTKDALAVPYLGAYAVVMGCAILALAIQAFTALPRAAGAVADGALPVRPLAVIAAQPRFSAAVVGAVVGYTVMNFVMTSTPLAMVGFNHHFDDTAFVIEWHSAAMFAPSFFTGSLIRRYGALPIMTSGALLMLGTAAVAEAGTSVAFFWTALVLLGLGWNFLFVGGTMMLTTTHSPAERGKVQGLNDLCVFSATGASSLLSGVMLQMLGWDKMVFSVLPLLVAMLVVLLWAARANPRPEGLAPAE